MFPAAAAHHRTSRGRASRRFVSISKNSQLGWSYLLHASLFFTYFPGNGTQIGYACTAHIRFEPRAPRWDFLNRTYMLLILPSKRPPPPLPHSPCSPQSLVVERVDAAGVPRCFLVPHVGKLLDCSWQDFLFAFPAITPSDCVFCNFNLEN